MLINRNPDLVCCPRTGDSYPVCAEASTRRISLRHKPPTRVIDGPTELQQAAVHTEIDLRRSERHCADSAKNVEFMNAPPKAANASRLCDEFAPQGRLRRKNCLGVEGLTAFVKTKEPLLSKAFVAIGVQLAKGEATLVVART